MTDTNYSRQYGWDEYGTLSLKQNAGVPLSGLTPYNSGTNPYNTANNHLPGTNYGYDARGMMTKLGAVTMAYDAEGNMKDNNDGGTGQNLTWIYDAEGQRAQKLVSGTANVLYVHDAFGQLAAEYNQSGITASCQTCYLTYDMLGTVRLVTNQRQAVVARHDYLPFAEEVFNGTAGRSGNFGAISNVTQGFTGQEADGGTATLHFFNARHMSGVLGTFVQPDPANAGADITRPQSWNAYGYVLGDPLGAVDPDGTTDCDPWSGCQYYNNRDNGYGGYGGGDGYSGVTGGDCFSASSSEPCGGFPGGGVGGTFGFGGGGSGTDKGTSSGGNTVYDVGAVFRAVSLFLNPASALLAKTGTLTCSGTARVLKGNAAHIGLPGGWDGPFVKPHILVTEDGAAIIPSQWGVTNKATFRPFLNSISGSFPKAKKSFKGVSEIVGGAPDPNFRKLPVQDGLMAHYPGRLIIELPGGNDLGITPVRLSLPSVLDCPEGTSQVP